MKRPKKVKLKRVPFQSYKTLYQCPFCKTLFEDYSFHENVTRFKCGHCENELIVDR
jgi:predicted SprT family Zn-dependent metalloprotease